MYDISSSHRRGSVFYASTSVPTLVDLAIIKIVVLETDEATYMSALGGTRYLTLVRFTVDRRPDHGVLGQQVGCLARPTAMDHVLAVPY